MDWAIDTSPRIERLYWLSGQAGAGKTAIAHSIAQQLAAGYKGGEPRLGGSFFCSDKFTDTRSATLMIRTLVYQLALISMPFRNALMQHGRFEAVSHGPWSQLTGLLVEPWMKSLSERQVNNEPDYVLVIDALNELEGKGGVEFLSVLRKVLDQKHFSGLKFFVTSRSEPDLVEKFQSFNNKQVCRLEEVPLTDIGKDIKLYLKHNLAQSATPHQIEQLILDASGLFIYAAEVTKYVKGAGRSIEEQRKYLRRLLPSNPPSSDQPPADATATLDSLYRQILETSLVDQTDRGDPHVFQHCLSILHAFVSTFERTSIEVAIALLRAGSGHIEVRKGTADAVLRRLHAVLYLQDGCVMSFHKSFADFLFDKNRSKEFYCDQKQVHHRFTLGCLQIMTEELRFNIAKIATSFQMDRDNPALPISIDANTSVCLRYAARNWSSHLILVSFEALKIFQELVQGFLGLQFLFWMETMNLLGHHERCQIMLHSTQKWFSKYEVRLSCKMARHVLTESQGRKGTGSSASGCSGVCCLSQREQGCTFNTPPIPIVPCHFPSNFRDCSALEKPV
jgi:NACHT domain